MHEPGSEAPTGQRMLAGALALFAVTVWGLSFVAVRIAIDGMTANGLVGLRSVIGAALLFVVLRLRGLPWLPEMQDRRRCLLLGAILGLHLWIQTVSLEHTTSIRASWIVSVIPALVAVCSAIFLRERIGALGITGIVLATAGVLWITSVQPAELARVRLGDGLVLASCFTWAAFSLLALGPFARSGALRMTAPCLAVAAVPSLLGALLSGSFVTEGFGPEQVVALLFLAIGASALALVAFGRALHDLGPDKASAFIFLQPLITLVGSFALLDEPLERTTLFGGPLVLLGVALVQRAKRRRAPLRTADQRGS